MPTMKTPGVYIVEKNAFPNSAVESATAIPAFIGYTEKAVQGINPLLNIPFKINSFSEYLQYFGGPCKAEFTIKEEVNNASLGFTLKRRDKFNMYYQIKFFFQNGGSTCYIVSVADYGKEEINDEELKNGIKILENIDEATMILVPEAIYLESAQCYSIQQEMLRHCAEMKNRIAILDIHNLDEKSEHIPNVITTFRENIGTNNLKYGVAYYPHLNTNVISEQDLKLTNFLYKEDSNSQLEVLENLISNEFNKKYFKELSLSINNININKNDLKDSKSADKNSKDRETVDKEIFKLIPKVYESYKQYGKNLFEKFENEVINYLKYDNLSKTLTYTWGAQKVNLETELRFMLINALKDLPAEQIFNENFLNEYSSLKNNKPLKENLQDKNIIKLLESKNSEKGLFIEYEDLANILKIPLFQINIVATLKKILPEITVKDLLSTHDTKDSTLKELDQNIKDIENLLKFMTFLNLETKLKNLDGKSKKYFLKSLNILLNQCHTSFHEIHKVLYTNSEVYQNIIKKATEILNTLPPSTAMAGVMTTVDQNIGVWKAPANVSLNNVVSTTVSINSKIQEDLNMPIDGKAINAIRYFPNEGVKVWGARTLDGNSQDWRYINVRRTMIMLESTIKNAVKAYVFEPNTANTWVSIKSMINNYLNSVWKRGGLAGATPDEAYSVHIGLGDTMTPDDILNGVLKIEILVAIARPAEFIEISFKQQLQTS